MWTRGRPGTGTRPIEAVPAGFQIATVLVRMRAEERFTLFLIPPYTNRPVAASAAFLIAAILAA